MADSLPAYTTLTRLYAGSTYINNTKTIHKSCLVITESIDITITAVNIVTEPISITLFVSTILNLNISVAKII